MKSKIIKKINKGSTKISISVVIFLLIISFLLFFALYPKNAQPHKMTGKASVKKVIIPTKGVFLGVSLFDQNYDTLLELEKKVDKQFAIVGVYQSWGDKNNNFNRGWADNIADHNSIPLITWEPWVPVSGYDRSENKIDQKEYRLVNITSGKFDGYIKSYADDIRDYSKPIIIRFTHEMNGNWYPWGSTLNTPQEYIAAWRHVHDVFVKEGATNVTWLWSPNAIYTNPHVPYADQINAFYPGDAYVDWVGFSAFNWAGRYKQNIWTAPTDLYSLTVSVLSTSKKPLVIAETASADSQTGKTKADWVTLLAIYMKNNPQVKGVVWFNTE
ncbi:MAG TPA: glycosyl hydrolase, partial [Candidatus Sulfotelmatobacter sp.]|nr:glycosyl hydrolase [Candidatus Sulfotelmatobacter sp.]